MNYKLRIAGIHYNKLRQHLYPGDGFEAVAIALCGRLELNNEIIFLIHKIFPIPYEDCTLREELFLDWKTDSIQPILIEADKYGLSVLKIHSHPSGYADFSKTDDHSDLKLFESVFGWTLNVQNHLSAVMLPDGGIFGRIIDEHLSFFNIPVISLISDDLKVFDFRERNGQSTEFDLRNIQAFGDGTIQKLKKMSVAIVGCSGTGSPVIEQLARLGVGELVLIDPDKVEEKNLNRILNATLDDAKNTRYKVDVISKAIKSFGFGTNVVTFKVNLFDSKEAIRKVASCDAIFGCVDSVDGRHLINLISNFYLLPLWDIGVRLDADGNGGIESINGTVHYVQPSKSSLYSRRVYTSEQLLSAGELRKNPEHYAHLEREKYLKKAKTDSPAVISINMFYASMAVNDFLARIHPFRIQSNSECAVQRFIMSEPVFINESANEEDSLFIKNLGRGDMIPLLKLPELS